ncbi:hypothetical protein [Lacticaseibacillus absianus]|uniref:hypothetical protein n=1 Tax=Lacticaseibacillus absianus TaxID=2729623 RepID=UPI0015CA3E74|nr:hypothetical protein [Lacticaseibacillus absianus]
MSKTDKELAVELTVALLNHNAQLHNLSNTEGAIGQSKASVVTGNTVGSNYQYLLGVIEGRIDALKAPAKSDTK